MSIKPTTRLQVNLSEHTAARLAEIREHYDGMALRHVLRIIVDAAYARLEAGGDIVEAKTSTKPKKPKKPTPYRSRKDYPYTYTNTPVHGYRHHKLVSLTDKFGQTCAFQFPVVPVLNDAGEFKEWRWADDERTQELSLAYIDYKQAVPIAFDEEYAGVEFTGFDSPREMYEATLHD